MNFGIENNVKSDNQLNQIKKSLGRPAHEDQDFLIYSGDCMELMNRLTESIVDLTVTSPPYNIGKEYEKVLILDKYLDWCEQWIGEIHRITVPNGTFWLNLGYVSIPKRVKAIPLPYLLWDRSPFFMMQEVIWHYGAGVAAKRFYSPRNEKFICYVKNPDDYVFNLDDVRDPNVKYPNQKKNGKLKCNTIGKNPTDVWQFPKVTSGKNRSSKERTPHPAQFPVAVIDRIIKASSNTGDLVLDPFLGSGTTIEVALANDRLAVGFELNEDYVEIAVQRIESAIKRQDQKRAQRTLFTG
jgi:adenine-specific DNA-methyltransferase